MGKKIYTYESIAIMRNIQRDQNGDPLERKEGDGKLKCLQCSELIHPSQGALKTKSGKHLHAKESGCRASKAWRENSKSEN